jgi:hypothetical protein
MKHLVRTVLALVVTSSCIAPLVKAETLTWHATLNGAWTNADFWKIGALPANRIPVSTDDVVIPASRVVSLDDTAEVASLVSGAPRSCPSAAPTPLCWAGDPRMRHARPR